MTAQAAGSANAPRSQAGTAKLESAPGTAPPPVTGGEGVGRAPRRRAAAQHRAGDVRGGPGLLRGVRVREGPHSGPGPQPRGPAACAAAYAGAERFRPGRSPRDEPWGRTRVRAPQAGTLTAPDPAPAACNPWWRNWSGDVSGPVVHRDTPAVEQVATPEGGFDPVAVEVGKHELVHLARRVGALGRPSRKLDRNPCATASKSRPCSKSVRVEWFSTRPVGEGNTSPAPSKSSAAASSTSSARGESGTRCSRLAFMCSAGIVHTAASRSTCPQRALRTSPERRPDLRVGQAAPACAVCAPRSSGAPRRARRRSGCRRGTRSRGRIHGMALWLPQGSDRLQRLMARDAAVAIDALVGRGIEVTVEPRGDERSRWAADPRRWTGPSPVTCPRRLVQIEC